MQTYRAGIDIGSTTVKLAILDDGGSILFGRYRRHMAHTQDALAQLLREAEQELGGCALRVFPVISQISRKGRRAGAGSRWLEAF